MNTPYVKQYNELGELTNPINGRYQSLVGANRRGRRAKQARFQNNKKGFKMIIVGSDRYFKRIQWIGDKQIIHYDLNAPKR